MSTAATTARGPAAHRRRFRASATCAARTCQLIAWRQTRCGRPIRRSSAAGRGRSSPPRRCGWRRFGIAGRARMDCGAVSGDRGPSSDRKSTTIRRCRSRSSPCNPPAGASAAREPRSGSRPRAHARPCGPTRCGRMPGAVPGRRQGVMAGRAPLQAHAANLRPGRTAPLPRGSAPALIRRFPARMPAAYTGRRCWQHGRRLPSITTGEDLRRCSMDLITASRA